MFTVYILFSAKLNKYYIGFTGDNVDNRLTKHLASHNGFTAKAKDWVIVFREVFPLKKDAMLRERQLKSWKSQIRIKELIMHSSNE